MISASRLVGVASGSGMTRDPDVDEALSLFVRGAGELEHVAVELDPHAAGLVGPEPAPDGAYERGERLRVACESNNEGADHQRLDRARIVGRRACRSRLDGVDIEFEQLGAE